LPKDINRFSPDFGVDVERASAVQDFFIAPLFGSDGSGVLPTIILDEIFIFKRTVLCGAVLKGCCFWASLP
jgi:hypothetical protein